MLPPCYAIDRGMGNDIYVWVQWIFAPRQLEVKSVEKKIKMPF